ncbi:MAG TPA: NF038129 family PEP-CTERM protein [Bryobacteraceae bacterium]|nr:NF038129 family PEP-CTERM protein [Bryobacteraceae bacterium]
MKAGTFTLLAAALWITPVFASTYTVTVDTSSLTNPTSGFIDFGFNGGFPATAAISNFALTGGALHGSSITTQGTIAGALPGTVTISQDTADYDEGLTFGSSVSFTLDLTGTPSGSVGDVFTFSFFNPNFTGGLLTGNNNDFWLAQFQMDTQGNITSTAFANPAGGPSFATIQAVSVGAPEPGTWALVGLGVLGAWLRRRMCPRPRLEE